MHREIVSCTATKRLRSPGPISYCSYVLSSRCMKSDQLKPSKHNGLVSPLTVYEDGTWSGKRSLDSLDIWV
jgi:hypothetical protein